MLLLLKFLFTLNLNNNLLSLNNNLLPLNNKKVILHLEKFNEKYNLLHIGITFINYNKYLRYDFRAFNNGKSSITNNINRNDARYIFPDLVTYFNNFDDIYKEYNTLLNNDIENRYSKNIYWGITNKTFCEIIAYEKNLNKKYILGVYDCRHYVNNFTNWALDKPTPIWELYKLWND